MPVPVPVPTLPAPGPAAPSQPVDGPAAAARSRGLLPVLLGIVALQVVLWIWACFALTYYQDDWPLSYAALENDLFSRSWLLLDNNGYVAPVASVLAWLTVRAAPFNYHAALTVTVALGLVLDWSAWVCLRTYLRPRRVTVIWFAVVALNPLWLLVVGWWTVGVAVLTASIASVWMLIGARRYADSHRVGWAALVVGAFLVSLLCTPKAALNGVFLALFVLTCLVDGSPATRIRIVLRRWIPVWAGVAVVGAAWLWAYLHLAVSRSTDLSVASNAWPLLRESFLGTFVPSLVGGPWAVGPGPVPFPYFGELPTWTVVVVFEAVALVVVAGHRAYRGRWLPLLPLTAMIAGNIVLLGWAAVSWFGPDITRQGRYWTDLLIPTVLCLALVATPPTSPDGAPIRQVRLRWPFVPSLVFALALLLLANSAMLTTTRTGEVMRSGTGSVFQANATRSLAEHRGATIFDRAMPSEIINVFFFPRDGMQSQALRYWVSDQSFDTPTDRYWIFDDTGSLAPARLLATATSIPGRSGACGYFASNKPVSIRFPGPLYKWKWVVQFSYLANGDFTATARAGSSTVQLPVRKGLNQIYFVVIDSFEEITVSTPSSADGLCVDFAAAGNLAPA